MEIVDLGKEREKRLDEERCPYCGETPHAGPLMCRRVSAIEIDSDTGKIYRVEFRDIDLEDFELDFGDDDGDPEDAA
jgi:hypothetical protein